MADKTVNPSNNQQLKPFERLSKEHGRQYNIGETRESAERRVLAGTINESSSLESQVTRLAQRPRRDLPQSIVVVRRRLCLRASENTSKLAGELAWIEKQSQHWERRLAKRRSKTQLEFRAINLVV